MRGWVRFGAGLACGVLLCAWFGRGLAVAAPTSGPAATPRASESAALAAPASMPPAVPSTALQRELVAKEVVDEPRPAEVRRRSAAGREQPTEREVLVVDEDDAPLPGVVVATDVRLFADGRVEFDGPPSMRTDGAGCARLAFAAGDLVHFVAPGRKLVEAFAPESSATWVVQLPTALRLDVQVVGVTTFEGLAVRVEMTRHREGRLFWESKHHETPGRVFEGGPARWSVEGRFRDRRAPQRGTWQLCLSATGGAALDQLEVDGDVHVGLMRFGRVIDTTTVGRARARGAVRVTLVASPLPPLSGVVADAAGRALAGARLRMAPYGDSRIVDSPRHGEPFPVWAPDVRSDAAGRFALPRADDPGERIVVRHEGHAASVLTVAELDATAGRIVLQHGHTVRAEILDCNEKPLEGGWTTGGHEYAEPSVLLGHDVWRGTSDRELPCVEFAELPAGPVTFRCAGETWRHDARVRVVRLLTERPVERMGIGKQGDAPGQRFLQTTSSRSTGNCC